MNKKISLVITAVVLLVGGALYLSRGRVSSPQNTALAATLQKQLDAIPTDAGKSNFEKQSHGLTQAVDAELVDLDSQITTCDSNVDGVASGTGTFSGSCNAASGGTAASVAGKYMGGQCCGALMDTKEYHENLEKLQAYKSMPDIPLDPMHTPVAMAKKWIDYDKATTLTPDEQKVFDAAYAISKEKPCCCKCWHYFVNEGVAKRMIKDGQFNSKEIADYWDASDICG